MALKQGVDLITVALLQVYQIISPYTSRLDNVLELYTGAACLSPAAACLYPVVNTLYNDRSAYDMLSSAIYLDQPQPYVSVSLIH